MDNVVMGTASQEIVYQAASVVISAVFIAIATFIKKFLSKSEFAQEYKLYNEKTENVLENAVIYAETVSKNFVRGEISKRDLAVKYIDNISPDIIAKEGQKLELMLDRKVGQLIDKRNMVKNDIQAKKEKAEG